jgi:hypothetical protein
MLALAFTGVWMKEGQFRRFINNELVDEATHVTERMPKMLTEKYSASL